MSLVTGLFFLVLLLNQRWSPPLKLHASHCSTFRIKCAVPSVAVFCSESIECFPGTVSKFFLKLLVTIPVAPIITGTIVHFRFHIRCISTHKLLYFTLVFIVLLLLLLLLNLRLTERYGWRFVFWNGTPCRLVNIWQHYGEFQYLHLHGSSSPILLVTWWWRR